MKSSHLYHDLTNITLSNEFKSLYCIELSKNRDIVYIAGVIGSKTPKKGCKIMILNSINDEIISNILTQRSP